MSLWRRNSWKICSFFLKLLGLWCIGIVRFFLLESCFWMHILNSILLQNMFFGIKRKISCFFIWRESAEFRSFAPNECNARPLARKKMKNFFWRLTVWYSAVNRYFVRRDPKFLQNFFREKFGAYEKSVYFCTR